MFTSKTFEYLLAKHVRFDKLNLVKLSFYETRGQGDNNQMCRSEMLL